MANIEEMPASPLDDVWELTASAFIVTFWQQLNEPRPGRVPMWESDMRRLVGARDVRDVFAWAEANGEGRIYTVKVEIPGIEKPTLAQIAGDDPTQAGPPKG